MAMIYIGNVKYDKRENIRLEDTKGRRVTAQELLRQIKTIQGENKRETRILISDYWDKPEKR